MISVPPTTICPEVTGSMPATQLSSVLLPEPLAPISETKSPSSIVRFTPSSGRIVSSPLTNSRCNIDDFDKCHVEFDSRLIELIW